MHDEEIWRQPKVLQAMGVSSATLGRRIREGIFVRPIRCGGAAARAVGWARSEVLAVQAAILEGADDGQLRNLVADIHAARGRGLEELLASARARAADSVGARV